MVNQKVVTAQEKQAKKALFVYTFIDFVVLFPVSAHFIFTSTGIFDIAVGLVFGLLATVLLVFGIFPYFPTKFSHNALVKDVNTIDKYVGANAKDIENTIGQNQSLIKQAAIGAGDMATKP